MKLEEIKNAFKEAKIDLASFLERLYFEDVEPEDEALIKEKVGEFLYVTAKRKLLDTDTQTFVAEVTCNDGEKLYLAIDGYYSSWDSTNFDDAEPYEAKKALMSVEVWADATTPETEKFKFL